MLYLVPTPIGNLEDITLRALRILKEVDLIACEDTRTTAKLCNHFDIDTPRTSYHEHNERGKTPGLINRLKAGQSIALVSDAGSPGISDPGFYLVRACREADIAVTALPGPTALIPALTASGLPADRFVFEGFLPHKKGRKSRVMNWIDEDRTVVLYESPHRIQRTLKLLIEILGEERQAAFAREWTKTFEEMHVGSLKELLEQLLEKDKIRGEFVLIIEGNRKKKNNKP